MRWRSLRCVCSRDSPVEAFGDQPLAQRATTLGEQIQTGVLRYGKIYNPKYGWMYVYETDGYGHDNLMDDANIPNLTALPWYGWCSTSDPVYLDTRRFTLSFDDPYYYTGKYATGLGSPHTPKGWVWPLGIIGAALSTTDRNEIVTAIDMLDRSDTLDGLMHESVNPNDPSAVYAAGVRVGERLLGRPALSHGRRLSGHADRSSDDDDTGDRQSEIPTITPAGTQLDDRAEIVRTLGRLLASTRRARGDGEVSRVSTTFRRDDRSRSPHPK